jgi:CDP-paratose 2-epimerase
MKVLVTGGCGFLGSHVCEFYAKRGDEVISFDTMTRHELIRNPYSADEARMYNYNFLKSLNVECIKGDVRNLEVLLDYSKDVSYIVHTAAQPTMTIGLENYDLDFSTNVIGTYNVLQTALKHKIPVATCASIHIYSNNLNQCLIEKPSRYHCEPVSFDEKLTTLDGVITPLHASKMTGDIYTRMFIDSYKLKAASFRLSGIYGTRQFGGEDHGWVANFAIRAFMNIALKIFHNGKQVRDIIAAPDVARAFHAFYKYQEPGVYNIGGGPNNSLSLIECIEIIKNLLNKDLIIENAGERFGDLYYFVCNIDKASEKLLWKPQIFPNEGIEMLLNWIKENIYLFSISS